MSFIDILQQRYTQQQQQIHREEKRVHVKHGVSVNQAVNRLMKLRERLTAMFVGREYEIITALAGLVSGIPTIFISPPGTAKTAIVDSIANAIEAKYFRILLTRKTEPHEVFGPIDVKYYRETGKVKYSIEGYLPWAEIAFIDEIFKASSSVRNMLLDIILYKRFKNGDEVVKVPLKAIYAASNEVSDDEEDRAIYDRFAIRNFHGYLPEDMLDDLIVVGVEVTVKGFNIGKIMSIEDVEVLQNLNKKLALEAAKNPVMRDAVKKIILAARDLGFEISDRRIVQYMFVTAALAIVGGSVRPSDLSPVYAADAAYLILPNTEEDVEKVEEVLSKSGVLSSDKMIAAIDEMLSKVEHLIKEYRKSGNIHLLRDARVIMSSIEKTVKTSRVKLPLNMRSRYERVKGELVREMESIASELKG